VGAKGSSSLSSSSSSSSVKVVGLSKEEVNKHLLQQQRVYDYDEAMKAIELYEKLQEEELRNHPLDFSTERDGK